jgi:hypothetical protein
MYMEPIVATKSVSRKPRAAALKLTAGAVSLPFIAAAMVFYWTLTALWLVVAGTASMTRGALSRV